MMIVCYQNHRSTHPTTQHLSIRKMSDDVPNSADIRQMSDDVPNTVEATYCRKPHDTDTETEEETVPRSQLFPII